MDCGCLKLTPVLCTGRPPPRNYMIDRNSVKYCKRIMVAVLLKSRAVRECNQWPGAGTTTYYFYSNIVLVLEVCRQGSLCTKLFTIFALDTKHLMRGRKKFFNNGYDNVQAIWMRLFAPTSCFYCCLATPPLH